MSNAPVPKPHPEIETALATLFSVPPPDAAFVERLERELLARASQAPQPRRRWPQVKARQGWRLAALGLALVLVLTLVVAGPRRVLAQVQRLLGYVPGVGFVDLDATRVLTAPVQVTRDGVTLRVTQVLAQPDETVVVFESEGLPAYALSQGSEGTVQDLTAALRLPDGTLLTGARQSVSRGAVSASGRLRFPPLPEGTYQVTLLLARLPIVKPGAAPEDWEVPLTLRLATGELVAALFPQPYSPAGAEATHHDITLRVLVVAHSPEATVVRLQAEWAEPAWRFGFFTGGESPRLGDDLGHVYGPPPPTAAIISVEEIVGVPPPQAGETVTPDAGLFHYELDQNFASLSPSATRLTLEVPEVTFNVPLTAEFEVDLGAQPRVGDFIPLDITLEAAGVPIRITGAWLEQRAVWQAPTETWLRFEVVPGAAGDGRSVRGLHFNMGSYMPAFSGASAEYDYGTGRLVSSLRFTSDQPLPTGSVRVHLAAASFVVPGPWVLAWDVPGRAQPSTAPVTLHPAEAAQTHNGLTLRAQSVTLTDRVTVAGLGLDDAPPGTTLEALLCSIPPQYVSACWLEDDRGNRYADPGVSLQTAVRPLTDTLIFDTAQPLAQRMTLHVPAIEVAVTGAASFEVDVPTTAVDLPRNQPWPVDIPVEVAGESLRFIEARLFETSGVPQLVLRTGPLDPPRDRWLTGLRLAAITGPDGEPADMTLAYGNAGPDFFSVEREYVAAVILPVMDPASGQVQPGRYHIELNGVNLGVRGPWALSWELP